VQLVFGDGPFFPDVPADDAILPLLSFEDEDGRRLNARRRLGWFGLRDVWPQMLWELSYVPLHELILRPSRRREQLVSVIIASRESTTATEPCAPASAHRARTPSARWPTCPT